MSLVIVHTLTDTKLSDAMLHCIHCHLIKLKMHQLLMCFRLFSLLPFLSIKPHYLLLSSINLYLNFTYSCVTHIHQFWCISNTFFCSTQFPFCLIFFLTLISFLCSSRASCSPKRRYCLDFSHFAVISGSIFVCRPLYLCHLLCFVNMAARAAIYVVEGQIINYKITSRNAFHLANMNSPMCSALQGCWCC